MKLYKIQYPWNSYVFNKQNLSGLCVLECVIMWVNTCIGYISKIFFFRKLDLIEIKWLQIRDQHIRRWGGCRHVNNSGGDISQWWDNFLFSGHLRKVNQVGGWTVHPHLANYSVSVRNYFHRLIIFIVIVRVTYFIRTTLVIGYSFTICRYHDVMPHKTLARHQSVIKNN